MEQQFEQLKHHGKGLVAFDAVLNAENGKLHHQLIVMRDGSIVLQTVTNPVLAFSDIGRMDSEISQETVEFSSLPESVQLALVEWLDARANNKNRILTHTLVDLGNGRSVTI